MTGTVAHLTSQEAEWLALAERASEGPWHITRYSGGFSFAGSPRVYAGTDVEFGEPHTIPSRFNRENDAAFIAAARTAVPELLGRLEALRQENERFRAEVVDTLKDRAAVCHHKARRYAQELTGRDAKQAEREWNLGGNELLAMAELFKQPDAGQGGIE